MKLLATDYDGTLKYAQHIMDVDLKAINEWKEAGYLFVIDTGRSYESIKTEAEKYNIPVDYFVTNNGGMVFDKDGCELFSSYLEYITSLDIMYIAKETEGVVSYVVNDGINRHRVVVNPNLEEKRYLTLKPDLEEDKVMDLGKYAQIVISMAETKMAQDLAAQLNGYFSDVIVAYANNYVVDVVPKGVSKATGLDFVREFEGLTELDVYTIGDSYNDVAMIEYTPNGACISTAPDDVKCFVQNQYDSIHEMIEANL